MQVPVLDWVASPGGKYRNSMMPVIGDPKLKPLGQAEIVNAVKRGGRRESGSANKGAWCNGNTWDFGSCNSGSNPDAPVARARREH